MLQPALIYCQDGDAWQALGEGEKRKERRGFQCWQRAVKSLSTGDGRGKREEMVISASPWHTVSLATLKSVSLPRISDLLHSGIVLILFNCTIHCGSQTRFSKIAANFGSTSKRFSIESNTESALKVSELWVKISSLLKLLKHQLKIFLHTNSCPFLFLNNIWLYTHNAAVRSNSYKIQSYFVFFSPLYRLRLCC